MSAVQRALIFDTDEAFDKGLAGVLADADYEVFRAGDRRSAQTILAEKRVLVVLLGINVSSEDAFADLKWLKQSFPLVEVVIFSGRGHFRTAFDVMSLGAFDFLVKSPEMGEFLPVIDRAFQKARAQYRSKLSTGRAWPRPEGDVEMLGESPGLRRVQAVIAKIAPVDSPVLISGETGAGKELVARMIHRLSRRGGGPFVALNCSAIPEALLENELFGHAKGAFTDSMQNKPGLLEEAEGGTLFLDEIGELCPALQAKFLRVLENGSFRRLGETKERHADVRIVAASNRNMFQEAKAGRFRSDLYYRLAVLLVDIPPLRRRREDIPVLVDHFFKTHCLAQNISGKRISPSAMRMLSEYDWPGNVREVRNVVERLAVLSGNNVITPADLVAIVDLSGGDFDLSSIAMDGKFASLGHNDRAAGDQTVAVYGRAHR